MVVKDPNGVLFFPTTVKYSKTSYGTSASQVLFSDFIVPLCGNRHKLMLVKDTNWVILSNSFKKNKSTINWMKLYGTNASEIQLFWSTNCCNLPGFFNRVFPPPLLFFCPLFPYNPERILLKSYVIHEWLNRHIRNNSHKKTTRTVLWLVCEVLPKETGVIRWEILAPTLVNFMFKLYNVGQIEIVDVQSFIYCLEKLP